MSNKSQHERVFDILAQFPEGLTRLEVCSLMEGMTPNRASAQLSALLHEGLATKNGARVSPDTGSVNVVYVPTGRPYSERSFEYEKTLPSRRRKASKDFAELGSLREWKRRAIERFPQLGVKPSILAARARVAAILREEGDNAKALLIEAGELDDSATMRIVIAIMEGA